MDHVKPECELSAENGNIFNLTGRASLALKRAGLRDEAKVMQKEVSASQSYDDALQAIMKYVEAT